MLALIFYCQLRSTIRFEPLHCWVLQIPRACWSGMIPLGREFAWQLVTNDLASSADACWVHPHPGGELVAHAVMAKLQGLHLCVEHFLLWAVDTQHDSASPRILPESTSCLLSSNSFGSLFVLNLWSQQTMSSWITTSMNQQSIHQPSGGQVAWINHGLYGGFWSHRDTPEHHS